MMAALPLLLLAAARSGVVEPGDFSQALRAAARSATVRIVNGTTRTEGSGVIIKQSGPHVYILTAGHVAARGDSLEVATFSAKSHPKPAVVYRSAEVLARSLVPDVAIVRVATRDVMPGVARLCPTGSAPEGKGLTALTVGCSDGQAPSCLTERVLGKRKVVKPGARAGSVCWEARTAPARGRSGGPLLDRRGNVIGLASGSGDGKGYYTHLEEVASFLKANGLGWLQE